MSDAEISVPSSTPPSESLSPLPADDSSSTPPSSSLISPLSPSSASTSVSSSVSTPKEKKRAGRPPATAPKPREPVNDSSERRYSARPNRGTKIPEMDSYLQSLALAQIKNEVKHEQRIVAKLEGEATADQKDAQKETKPAVIEERKKENEEKPKEKPKETPAPTVNENASMDSSAKKRTPKAKRSAPEEIHKEETSASKNESVEGESNETKKPKKNEPKQTPVAKKKKTDDNELIATVNVNPSNTVIVTGTEQMKSSMHALMQKGLSNDTIETLKGKSILEVSKVLIDSMETFHEVTALMNYMAEAAKNQIFAISNKKKHRSDNASKLDSPAPSRPSSDIPPSPFTAAMQQGKISNDQSAIPMEIDQNTNAAAQTVPPTTENPSSL